jgi:hypothetical protein
MGDAPVGLTCDGRKPRMLAPASLAAAPEAVDRGLAR